MNSDVEYLKLFSRFVTLILILSEVIFKGAKDVIYIRNLNC